MWLFRKSYEGNERMVGKTAVITGGNAGIGKETTLDLYRRGCRVIMLCRDQEKAKLAIEDIKTQCAEVENVGELTLLRLDLGDLSSVRACAKEILENETHIHLLINNAGIFGCPQLKTKDGYDIHFGTNHLGHFLLTMLLLPTIFKSAPARIINVSSVAHKLPYYGRKIHFEDIHYEKRRYRINSSYGQSKLANVMFTKELARRLKEANIENITVHSLHPGIIASELGRHFDMYLRGFSWLWKHCSNWILMTPKQGAQTTLYCALDPKLAEETGGYYENCSAASPASFSYNVEACKRLWDISLNSVNLVAYDPFTISLVLGVRSLFGHSVDGAAGAVSRTRTSLH
ncbi:uncharacterized protein CBL_00133 [Carabus blaptoides fortunei]